MCFRPFKKGPCFNGSSFGAVRDRNQVPHTLPDARKRKSLNKCDEGLNEVVDDFLVNFYLLGPTKFFSSYTSTNPLL